MSATTTLILGGGFGGLATAHTLRRRLPDDHKIILFDKTPAFHIGAGKTWVMLGDKRVADISRPRPNLIPNGVGYVETEITAIDAHAGEVSTTHGTYRGDHLVIALGADMNMGAVPGLAEAGHTFYTLEGAIELQPILETVTAGEIVILIPKTPFKCPPAPYEAAMLLHHTFEQRGLRDKINLSIYTIEGAPMSTAGPQMGELVRDEARGRGINVYYQKKTSRVEPGRKTIVFDDGSEARYDLLLAVPPHEAPRVVREAGLLGPGGWIPVNPQTLQATTASGPCPVYAIGDVATVPLPGRYKPDMPLALPKAGVFAAAHGHIVASQIAARVLGQETAEVFDGQGFCYLETGGATALKADGNFFALPHPQMLRRPPDAAQFQDKLAWVERMLDAGF